MSTWIEQRWRELDPAPDKAVFQLVDAGHPLRFYIGRDIAGEHMLLLIEPTKPPLLKNMRGVQITSFRRTDGEWGLLLKLTAPEFLSVFSLLCEDLIISSKGVDTREKGSTFVIFRLNAWRYMLEEGRVTQLSINEIRGLFGELFFLDRYLLPMMNLVGAINSWAGPFGADQDFQHGTQAFEIKTVQPDAQVINIASETQLHSTVRSVHLAVLTLVEVPSNSGISLNTLVADLREKASTDVTASAALEERLVLAKYVAQSAYDSPAFSVVSGSMFFVDGTFPRIEPSLLPHGVVNVRYQLQLTSIDENKVESLFCSGTSR